MIALFMAITGLIAFLDMGLAPTLARELNDQSRVGTTRSDLLYTYEIAYAVLVAFVMLIIMIVPISWFQIFLSETDFVRPEIRESMRLIFVSAIAQLWFNFYVSALLGIEQPVKGNVVIVTAGVVRSALVIVPIWLIPSPVVFLWWQFIATLTFSIIARYVLYKLMASTRSHRAPVFDFGLVLGNSTFTLTVFLVSIAAGVNTQIDKLFIGRQMGLAALAHYSIAATLAQLLVFGVTPITLLLMPRLVRIVSSDNSESAANLFQLAHRLVSALVCAGAGFMIWFGPDIIGLWTDGKIQVESVASYLPMLVIGYGLLALEMVPHSMALANKNMRGSLMIAASVFLTVPCYWFLIGHFGAQGAAATWLVLQAIVFPCYFTWVIRSHTTLGHPFSLIFLTVLLPFGASLLIAFAASHLLGGSEAVALNVLVMFVTAVLLVVLCLTITLRPSDRQLLIRSLMQ